MQNDRISGRYAKALLDLATERNELAQINDQFNDLGEMIASSKELRDLLETPVIPTSTKGKVLKSLCGTEMPDLGNNFLDIILNRKREGYLANIIENFKLLYNEKMNIHPAKVRSAAPLTAEQKERILALIQTETTGTVELEEQIDPSLIGGFILSIKDKQIDASVSGKLRNLKKNLKTTLTK